MNYDDECNLVQYHKKNRVTVPPRSRLLKLSSVSDAVVCKEMEFSSLCCKGNKYYLECRVCVHKGFRYYILLQILLSPFIHFFQSALYN